MKNSHYWFVISLGLDCVGRRRNSHSAKQNHLIGLQKTQQNLIGARQRFGLCNRNCAVPQASRRKADELVISLGAEHKCWH